MFDLGNQKERILKCLKRNKARETVMNLHPESKPNLRDAGAVAAFVGAISVLLLIACYVISRLASERAYREKWRDYNDCGWA